MGAQAQTRDEKATLLVQAANCQMRPMDKEN
jgi:hypothetical protein